ncbi:MAG: hypothetical protein JSV34_07060, partial [Candidatus Omnitrophota bacterium]
MNRKVKQLIESAYDNVMLGFREHFKLKKRIEQMKQGYCKIFRYQLSQARAQADQELYERVYFLYSLFLERMEGVEETLQGDLNKKAAAYMLRLKEEFAVLEPFLENAAAQEEESKQEAEDRMFVQMHDKLEAEHQQRERLIEEEEELAKEYVKKGKFSWFFSRFLEMVKEKAHGRTNVWTKCFVTAAAVFVVVSWAEHGIANAQDMTLDSYKQTLNRLESLQNSLNKIKEQKKSDETVVLENKINKEIEPLVEYKKVLEDTLIFEALKKELDGFAKRIKKFPAYLRLKALQQKAQQLLDRGRGLLGMYSLGDENADSSRGRFQKFMGELPEFIKDATYKRKSVDVEDFKKMVEVILSVSGSDKDKSFEEELLLFIYGANEADVKKIVGTDGFIYASFFEDGVTGGRRKFKADAAEKLEIAISKANQLESRLEGKLKS